MFNSFYIDFILDYFNHDFYYNNHYFYYSSNHDLDGNWGYNYCYSYQNFLIGIIVNNNYKN